MADIIKGLFGGAKPSPVSSGSPVDADFADFANAPSPTPITVSSTVSGAPAAAKTFGAHINIADRPFTKWYNVHERVTWADFKMEAFLLPLIAAIVLLHVWGTRTNRRKASGWIKAHQPALEAEFASVGFKGRRGAAAGSVPEPEGEALKEKSKDVFISYATGRQNVAFVDVKLSLYKRYNPFALIGEAGLAFFFDSGPMPSEKIEVSAYAFDGKEAQFFSRVPGAEAAPRGKDSTYDGFVWAVVHKDEMKRLRDERYDLSLTTTKDHAKLPAWASIMSESAEITETLLTNELVQAVDAAGDDFESLIVTDLPQDAPKTAHFRPEVMRRVKTTREEEKKKISKLTEAESAEERKTAMDKAKLQARDAKLKGMSADEQRKFLEKERQKNERKSMGRKTVKA